MKERKRTKDKFEKRKKVTPIDYRFCWIASIRSVRMATLVVRVARFAVRAARFAVWVEAFAVSAFNLSITCPICSFCTWLTVRPMPGMTQATPKAILWSRRTSSSSWIQLSLALTRRTVLDSFSVDSVYIGHFVVKNIVSRLNILGVQLNLDSRG